MRDPSKLRSGFTTGTCSAAASKAAAEILFTGKPIPAVSVSLPKGGSLLLDIKEISASPVEVVCGVKKESGDDPDVTNQMMIYARVKKSETPGIRIKGGVGIGIVTKPGLSIPVGQAAINPTPLGMIRKELEEVCERHEFQKGLEVTIFAPQGEELAKKTFNGRLGIQGGISILGTTGIVTPMSEDAIKETIRLELRQKVANLGTEVIACPGNYGEAFIRNKLEVVYQPVLCSNYIGEILDYSRSCGVTKFLLVGHGGKLVKLAAGIMNTHSRMADGRMEVLAAHAASLGASQRMVMGILEATTTEIANAILESEAGLKDKVYDRLVVKMVDYMSRRVFQEIEVGVILFNNHQEIMGQSNNAPALLKCFPKMELM